jgi:hypothetical protein
MSIILIFFMDSPELTLGIRAPATPAGNSLDGCPRQVLGITESVMPDECGMNYQISPENPRDSEEYTLIEAALETVWRNRDRLGPPRSPNVGIPLPRGGLMYSRANVRTNFNDPSVTIQQSQH